MLRMDRPTFNKGALVFSMNKCINYDLLMNNSALLI